MTTNQKAVAAALYRLISKKDPSVFQSIEIFGQSIEKTAAVVTCPESEAIKAGLKERFPWVMQSENTGTISQAMAQNLKNLLVNKHSTTEATADWAVKCWAKALHLEVEGAVAQTITGKSPPFPKNANNRIGITYAVDSGQNLKVFDCWYDSASHSEAAGLAPSAQKREFSDANDTFAGLAKSRPDSDSAARSQSNAAAPRPSKARSATKTTKPEKTTKSGPPPLPKSTATDATGLYDQAIELLAERGKQAAVAMAHSLLAQAANLGSIKAHRTLGELYLKGLGTPTDFNQAATHLSLAAEKGDADAQFHLASLYQCGMGVEFDIQKAIYWLKKANDQGHAKAASLMQEILDDMNNS